MRHTPRLVSFYIRMCLAGFVLAALFVGALLATNVVGLRDLILSSPSGPLALFLLWFFNGIVFAGAQTSVRLLLMADGPEGEGPRRGMGIPVRVPTAAGPTARRPVPQSGRSADGIIGKNCPSDQRPNQLCPSTS